MTEMKKGQRVKFTNPRQQERVGTYVGSVDLGAGRGKGIYARVDVEGKTFRVRPSKLIAI